MTVTTIMTKVQYLLQTGHICYNHKSYSHMTQRMLENVRVTESRSINMVLQASEIPEGISRFL